MHPIRRFAFVSVLTLGAAAGGAGGTFAHAEDEAPASSPAEQAFKDAWWAETGGGNLNEALALYEKAAATEGPASVKVKARYRRALLLQRIGKTEEAIRALESLATDHPDIAELQAEVRARLEEWTAVDLRTGFPEWYSRFQYGPEFQAKVLDLVLRMGSTDTQATAAAERELITIGEPSIGALRAHLGARNASLRNNAVKVLLTLGVVPNEVTTSLGTWTYRSELWGRIFDLPAERRAALLALLPAEKGSEPQEALRAVLTGPPAVLAWLAGLPAGGSANSVRSPVWYALHDRLSSQPEVADTVRRLLAGTIPDGQVWGWLAGWLVAKGLATRADVEPWRALPFAVAGPVLSRASLDERLFARREGLALLLEVAAKRPQNERSKWLYEDLAAMIEVAPWPEALDPLARAWGAQAAQVEQQHGVRATATDRLIQVVERGIELELEEQSVKLMWSSWSRLTGERPDAGRDVAFAERLVRTGARTFHRQLALQALTQVLAASERERALALLLDPEASPNDLHGRWSWILGQWHHAGQLLVEQESLQRLVERIAVVERTRPPVDKVSAEAMARSLCRTLHDRSVDPTALLLLWLEQPGQFPAAFWGPDGSAQLRHLLAAAGRAVEVQQRFRERWATANPEDRVGLLRGVELFVEGKAWNPGMQEFWREVLKARPRAFPLEQRGRIILPLGQALSLDDVRTFYDLEQPEEADQAAEWWLPTSRTQFPGSAEAFEALRLAFRPEGPYAARLAGSFLGVEAVWRPLAVLLLAHKEAAARLVGVQFLLKRSAPEDGELWAQALRDPSVEVRVLAAKSMERVPTPTTTKALVAALDDPHPDVRAAALESLDAIQKMEDLKARWREKVR